MPLFISSSMNLTQGLIIVLSAGAFFSLFALTSFLNFLSVLRGEKPITHVSSLFAGKIINLLFLTLIAIGSIAGLIPMAHFFDYAYLFLCVNAAVKINWNLFAATDTSMHSKLLTTIHTLGPISHDALLKIYNRDEIFKARIPRMLALNQIQVVDGKYILSGNFVIYAAQILALFRRILGIPVRPEQNIK